MKTKTNAFGIRYLVPIVLFAVILIGGVSITGAAAQTAIPGDALYPIKTGMEQTRLSLAGDAGNRAQLKMQFAELRLGEIEKLIEDGRFREVDQAVLDFESAINSALLELQTVAAGDPARAASIAQEITSSLTRYAQTLGKMAATAPENVQSVVSRALDSTRSAASLDIPAGVMSLDDNGNGNENTNDDSLINGNSNSLDDSLNGNGDDGALNSNDDVLNANSDNTTFNGNDDAQNANSDDSLINDNANSNDDSAENSNSNADDDSGNTNTNGDDHGGSGKGGDD